MDLVDACVAGIRKLAARLDGQHGETVDKQGTMRRERRVLFIRSPRLESFIDAYLLEKQRSTLGLFH